MDRWKAEQGRGREKRKIRREKIRRERVRRKKMQMREKVGKSRNIAKHYVFPMIWGSGGSKSRLAKAAGAEPPSAFFSCASNVEIHQRHTNQHWVGNKGLEQGRPQLRLQKSYQFQVPKRNPKLAPLVPDHDIPFLLCWWKKSRVSKACNRGASRLGEAWPRPRLKHKTYWHKDKARLPGTRNYIILLLKSQQGWTWSSW